MNEKCTCLRNLIKNGLKRQSSKPVRVVNYSILLGDSFNGSAFQDHVKQSSTNTSKNLL